MDAMNQTSGQPSKKSPWVYVGIGCVVLFALFLLVVGGVVFWGYRAIKQVEAGWQDPVARTAKVKEVLGASELPDGYHAFMSLSIPWIMDMAVLSDKEGAPGHGSKPFDERGFIYIKAIHGRGNDRELRDYFEGKADPGELLKRGSIDVHTGKQIGRGSFKTADSTVYYTSNLGTIRMHRETIQGIMTFIFLDCPGDNKVRMGIWFGPDPGKEGSAAAGNESSSATHATSGWSHTVSIGSLDAKDQGDPDDTGSSSPDDGGPGTGVPAGPEYSGTPADESALREFLAHFSVCGA